MADAKTGLVAVGVRDPSRLVLVDGRSGRIVERVALPGGVRHLQLAAPGGPVLLPSEGADALLAVELPLRGCRLARGHRQLPARQLIDP